MSTERQISTGTVVGIFTAPTRESPMQAHTEIEAIQGVGLAGDRYAKGGGSYNDPKRKGKGVGHRQVSIMNAKFFKGTLFDFIDSRRGIITEGVELLWLLGKKEEFRIGNAVFRAVGYLDPCGIPSNRCGKPGFKETFFETGAIIAEVLQTGTFRVGDPVYHRYKGYD